MLRTLLGRGLAPEAEQREHTEHGGSGRPHNSTCQGTETVTRGPSTAKGDQGDSKPGPRAPNPGYF